MEDTRAKLEPWLEKCLRKRHPELERPLLAAIDAFDTIQEEQRLDAKLIAPIVEAASSSRRPLYENATDLLGALTGKYALARECIVRMIEDSRSHVRFNALLCLTKASPTEFKLHLLRHGLRDKSAKVRAKAADWAGHFRVYDIVPDLEYALSIEKNAKTKHVIDFELRLLSHGHILERASDDGFNVTTFSSNGIASTWVSRAELEQRGVQSIVAKLASR